MDGDFCFPDSFYDDKYREEFPFTPAYIVVWIILFNMIHSPFLILMPFFVSKLKTNTRRIIAMIVLSDIAASVTTNQVQFYGFRGADGLKCLILTQFLGVTRDWSQLWSLALIVNVYFILDSRWVLQGNSVKFFLICHFVVWPYGMFLTYLNTLAPPLEITRFENGLLSAGCRGNVTFVLTDDGEDCLMTGIGKYMLILYFLNLILLMIAAVALFLKSVHIVRKKLNKCEKSKIEMTVRNVNTSESCRFVDENNRVILKTTMRLSATAFTYAISISPMIASNTYKLFYGDIKNQLMRSIFDFYPSICQAIIGFLNIISYFYLSPGFRKEVIKLIKKSTSYFRKTNQDGENSLTSSRSNMNNRAQGTLDVSISTSISMTRESEIFARRKTEED